MTLSTYATTRRAKMSIMNYDVNRHKDFRTPDCNPSNREEDPCYAACTYALCDAFFAGARRQRASRVAQPALRAALRRAGERGDRLAVAGGARERGGRVSSGVC